MTSVELEWMVNVQLQCTWWSTAIQAILCIYPILVYQYIHTETAHLSLVWRVALFIVSSVGMINSDIGNNTTWGFPGIIMMRWYSFSYLSWQVRACFWRHQLIFVCKGKIISSVSCSKPVSIILQVGVGVDDLTSGVDTDIPTSNMWFWHWTSAVWVTKSLTLRYLILNCLSPDSYRPNRAQQLVCWSDSMCGNAAPVT